MRWTRCAMCGKEKPYTMFRHDQLTWNIQSECVTCRKRIANSLRNAERGPVEKHYTEKHPGRFASWTDWDKAAVAAHCNRSAAELEPILHRSATSIRKYINDHSKVYCTRGGIIRKRDDAPSGEIW